MQGHRVAVLGGMRTPFCRAGTSYAQVGNLELLSAALKGLVAKFKLEGQELGEVAAGTVVQHSRDWTLAREGLHHSGLSPATPAYVVQRACGTSLEASIAIANKIALGQISVGVGAGVDSLTDIPVEFSRNLALGFVQLSKVKSLKDRIAVISKLRFGDFKPTAFGITEPGTGLTMGDHCELMVKEWKISREDQDVLSLASHHRAAAAYDRGFYSDLVTEYLGARFDNLVRKDTSLEKLGKLKPVYDRSARGTLTAGNSSPLTDGAAAVLLSSEAWAKGRGLEPLCYIEDIEIAAVNIKEEGLLMAPAYAVGRMLHRNNIGFSDIDFYEIHEAFAGQVLCTLKAWESEVFCRTKIKIPSVLGSIDRSKLNVCGGSVALGHPFGATGARVLATAAKLLKEKGAGRALLSICTGGGMGVTALLKR